MVGVIYIVMLGFSFTECLTSDERLAVYDSYISVSIFWLTDSPKCLSEAAGV